MYDLTRDSDYNCSAETNSCGNCNNFLKSLKYFIFHCIYILVVLYYVIIVCHGFNGHFRRELYKY